MRQNIELKISVAPSVRKLADLIRASRKLITSAEMEFAAENEAVLMWYIEARYRGYPPIDDDRSPRSNLASFNLMQVRDLPCTR